MVCSIQKSSFWDLAFLISKHGPISEISKIMIFINKTKDVIKIKRYLWSRLPDYICNKNQIFVII